MNITFEKENNFTEIKVLCRIDATNANDFDLMVSEHLTTNQDISAIILNLENVEYVSSAGLRSILKLAKNCMSKKIKMITCAIRPNVNEVLRISGFTKILEICNTKENAIELLQ